ncbi:acetyl-CoA carboxylase biotin carboxyl carrier protein subunit [Kocuria flava]|uniref:Biotin carboxyl carrier protein of acetyl-CoA carboxylase n=1 Tax=Kocuria flava TaxID=446860 RepID=A0A0U2YU80_9MICC|nr:acetyl-CoA carboxylase [Kocuria flava]ALU39089.1 acetyl-CoA carboxylase biotin carboxyl carrier protein subunit [Kocuria flava]PLC11287.1 acetyl-CoA carboxylase biotin carboxyl carrier protein subunit [Kocuria flava]GEO90756.1 acetyl-CoA carboxylase biotin carboxyl carrier protein subunit [Kocuria flava]
MAEIQSPLPGVFYRKPGPDKDPYVQEGDRVEAGQVIGMVEIMKQFTEVHSDVAGTLESFSVEDAAMVNPGDTIAVVAEG